MVNWQAPEILALDSLILVKTILFIDGVYIWDWLMDLPYEYRLLTRKELRRWPVLIYLGCRISAVTTVVASLILINTTSQINCDLMARAGSTSASVAIGMSSILIALRSIAIWRQHVFVIVVVALLSATNVAFLIRDVIPDPGVLWNPVEQVCGISFDITVQRPTIWVSFGTDLGLIVIMLAGLIKYKGSGALSKLVFQQGVIWCIVAVVSYIPSVVMITLNLNTPLSLSVQMPMCLIMVLCTTSMQRRLSEYKPPFLLPSAVHRQNWAPGVTIFSTKEPVTHHPISLPTPAFTTPEQLRSPHNDSLLPMRLAAGSSLSLSSTPP